MSRPIRLLVYAAGDSAASLQANLHIGDPAFTLIDQSHVLLGENIWVMCAVERLTSTFIESLPVSRITHVYLWAPFLTYATTNLFRAIALNTSLTHSVVAIKYLYEPPTPSTPTSTPSTPTPTQQPFLCPFLCP